MDISLGGDILSAWLPPKLKKHYVSADLNKQIDLSTAQLGKYRDLNDLSLSDFADSMGVAKKNLNALAPGDTAAYSGMIDWLKDPNQSFDMFSRVRGSDLGLIDKASAGLNYGVSKARKLAADNLYGPGGGGRPASSYDNLLQSRDIGSQLLPLYSQALAGGGDTANMLLNNTRANFGSAAGYIGDRANIPMRGAYTDLASIYARNDALNNEVATGNNLASSYRNNLLGTELKENPWAATAKALDKAGSTALTAYTGGLGGGAGGMMGGGGGGGSSSGTGSGFNFSNPFSGGSQNTNQVAGSGSGGGFQAMIAQAMQQLLGGQGGSRGGASQIFGMPVQYGSYSDARQLMPVQYGGYGGPAYSTGSSGGTPSAFDTNPYWGGYLGG